MSSLPENELDLEKLFLPAWAQEPASAKTYTHYEGGDDRRERRGDRPGRRPGQRPGSPGDRPRGNRPPPSGDRRGPRPEGGGRRPFGDKRPFDRDRQGGRREEPRERREPPPPLPEINLTFMPDERGVESLARQIRTTGRAYPLFDIARLILQRPERYSLTFAVKKKPDGQVAQPLFVCALDDTLWLSEEEAVVHVLKNHFATFYQTERTATEPPKGKYTFVAQCGMSGAILGPPNHHDYQNQLRKLHAERFSRMPFEAFKSRVKIVRDEEVVKKWIDDQSWKTDFVCLNMPEPQRLTDREAVEKHFREIHKVNIIKPAESHTLLGSSARGLRSAGLSNLVRQLSEDQKRFPLQIATVLSQQFAGQGLQFFKVNKTITHVSVARPHFLDLETTPVSEGVKRIVDFINAHPKCSRRKLVDALAPSPAVVPIPAAAPAGEGESAVVTQAPGPTPEQTAVVSDLHWLIHQGHVIEFANGTLETAKKPVPKPPRPEPKAAAPTAETAGETTATEAPPTVESGEVSGEQPPANVETPPASPEPTAAATEPAAQPTEQTAPAASENPASTENPPEPSPAPAESQ